MTHNLEARLRKAITETQDFPKPGILFRDSMPILYDHELRSDVITTFWERYKNRDVTAVAGPESRGFLFGALLANALGVSFVPVRKPGKLPGEVYRELYELEYGNDELQIQKDALTSGDSVVIIDDLLATGGTAEAACRLVEQAGAAVEESAFVIELEALEGRKRLGERAVFSLVKY